MTPTQAPTGITIVEDMQATLDGLGDEAKCSNDEHGATHRLILPCRHTWNMCTPCTDVERRAIAVFIKMGRDPECRKCNVAVDRHNIKVVEI